MSEPGTASAAAHADAPAPGQTAPGPLSPLRERLFLALLVLAVAPAVVGLTREWLRVDYLSHAFLVPVVSLWIWMRERPRRERHAIVPDPPGMIAVGAGLLVMATGVLVSEISLQGVGVVAAVAGACWWLRGRAWLREAAFPLGFLLFMVPPPNAWMTPLIVQLQTWVSIVAVDILNSLGAPVLREGNVMILPGGGALFVAEACSGVTSVVTLAPLGVLLGYLGLKTLPSRLLLALSVIPLAMAGNLARVLATAWLSNRYSVEFATEGPIHTMLGLSTYVVAVVLMIGVDALLRQREARRA